MEDIIETGLSRRRMIGAVAAAIGTAGVVAGVAPQPAHAGIDQSGSLGVANAAPTPLKPALRYAMFSGYDFHAMVSTAAWSAYDGYFRYTGTTGDWTRLAAELPVGAVIKELELYGQHAGGTTSVELWKSTIASGATSFVSAADTNVAGPFTLTHATNFAVTDTVKPTVFARMAAGTLISGCRIGYVPPPNFVPFSGPNPRVYDTRFGGLTKLAPNEERLVSLGLPAGIGAAILTLTLSGTEGGGGYVAVFNADIPTWPGNSSVNWSAPGQDVANTVVTPVSADGRIKIRGGANRTHVIIDVTGHLA